MQMMFSPADSTGIPLLGLVLLGPSRIVPSTVQMLQVRKFPFQRPLNTETVEKVFGAKTRDGAANIRHTG